MEDSNIENDSEAVEVEQDAFEEAVTDDKQQAECAAQYKALEVAWIAAEAGDAIGMLTAIHESRFLDGLFRVLRSMERFEQLPDSEIEMAIAEGVENFYARVKTGVKILNLPAYLWKTVQRSALARYRNKQVQLMSTESVELESRVTPLYADAAPRIPGQEDAEAKQQVEADQRRKAMLQFAHRILPRIGQDNIQKVMRSVLKAVEREEIHWPPSAIAVETGLKPNTVSVLLARGFERIAREAEKAGLKNQINAKRFIESSNMN